MKAAGYELDFLVVGFPGKSVCHGGLGWSTIALLRGHGRIALIDTGPMGMRKVLIAKLRELGYTPADVTDVLLTHSHHDHSINWTLFPNATIAIGADELSWSLDQAWGETPVPELYMRELATWPRARRLGEGEMALPNLRVHLAPGHTPGHLIFVLQDAEHDVIFLGDAAKTRAELVTRHVEASLDTAQSAATLEMIWAHWRARPGSIVVPGHDVPMTLREGEPHAMRRHDAAISVDFGTGEGSFRVIDLTADVAA